MHRQECLGICLSLLHCPAPAPLRVDANLMISHVLPLFSYSHTILHKRWNLSRLLSYSRKSRELKASPSRHTQKTIVLWPSLKLLAICSRKKLPRNPPGTNLRKGSTTLRKRRARVSNQQMESNTAWRAGVIFSRSGMSICPVRGAKSYVG